MYLLYTCTRTERTLRLTGAAIVIYVYTVSEVGGGVIETAQRTIVIKHRGVPIQLYGLVDLHDVYIYIYIERAQMKRKRRRRRRRQRLRRWRNPITDRFCRYSCAVRVEVTTARGSRADGHCTRSYTIKIIRPTYFIIYYIVMFANRSYVRPVCAETRHALAILPIHI